MVAVSIVDRAVALSLPVFPVRLCKDACLRCDVCKKPACLHGFKDATTDPDATRQLWRMYPGELIGIPTGETSERDNG